MQNDFLAELDNELSGDGMTPNQAPSTPKEEKIPQAKPHTSNNQRQGRHQNRGHHHQKNNQNGRPHFSHKKPQDDEEETGVSMPSLKETLMNNFPQVKFYLPSIRPGYTRFIPV